MKYGISLYVGSLMNAVKIAVVTRFGIGMKDKEWYEYRYNVHKTFGQLCMLDQTNQDFEWVICLDTNPPAEFLRKLEDDFKGRSNVHLLRIKKDWIAEYRDFINDHILTADTQKLVLVRRDDDDGVPINFIHDIYDFLQNNDVQLHFVPEKHNADDGCLTRRMGPLNTSFHWGRLITTFFHDRPEILKYIFFARSGADTIMYYKNTYIGNVGRIAKYGTVDAQLRKLDSRIEGLRDSGFTPYLYINQNTGGFVFNRKGGNEFESLAGFTHSTLYSILPVENNRLTAFRDYMYDTSKTHHGVCTCGIEAVYNSITTPGQFIYVRTQVNDCLGGMKASISTGEPHELNDSLKKTFSITDEGWRLWLGTHTEYEVPRYSVDRACKSLKDTAGDRSTHTEYNVPKKVVERNIMLGEKTVYELDVEEAASTD